MLFEKDIAALLRSKRGVSKLPFPFFASPNFDLSVPNRACSHFLAYTVGIMSEMDESKEIAMPAREKYPGKVYGV